MTSAEITVVLAYLHLCAEDYRWWWRSFLTAGASKKNKLYEGSLKAQLRTAGGGAPSSPQVCP
jgi:hypothetical protein